MNIHIHRMSKQQRGTRSYLEPKRRQQDTCNKPSKKAQKGYFSFRSTVHFYATQTSIFFPLKCPFNPLKCPSPKKKNQNVLIGTLAFTTLRAISGDNKLVIYFLENWLWYFMQIVSLGDKLQTCMMFRQQDTCNKPSKKAQKGYFSFRSNVHFYAAQTSIFFRSNVLSIRSNVLCRKKKIKMFWLAL